MLRERLTQQKSISFTGKRAEEIQEIADKLKVHFADVVRECVDKELPRLKERLRKRKAARNTDE